MEEELELTNDELKKLFIDKKIVDTGKGWYYEGKEIEILAVHKLETKYLRDVANSNSYKIRWKEK
ncbi:MAG: hypothetical protein U9Q33_03955 [Campylobacterota bacterium]|nr:hypothetical protein [Campylobacterota bacterium]